MTNDQLRASIANVREVMQVALESSERDLLGHLLSEMVRGPQVAVAAGGAALAVNNDIGSLTDQLDEQAVGFESEHPQLARALRELIDALNKMGV